MKYAGPPWIEEWWAAHGAEVIADGLGRWKIEERFGLSPYRAGEVLKYAKRVGTSIRPPRVSEPPKREEPTPSSGAPVSHLVIGDAHVKPNQDLRRFEWLAHVVAKLRPDVVVCLGDWYDMESLSSYDKGKRSFEGRRYTADIAAGDEALRVFHSTLRRLAGDYRPRFVVVLGNHEARADRAANDAAELEGIVGTRVIVESFERYGWEVHPFKAVAVVDGVHYSHFFPSGVMGKAISGEYPAANLIKKGFGTCVAGHAHIKDIASRHDVDGNVMRGVIAGCFFEHDEDYAGPANKMFWRGLLMLRDVCDGDFDVEEISMRRIRRMIEAA